MSTLCYPAPVVKPNPAAPASPLDWDALYLASEPGSARARLALRMMVRQAEASAALPAAPSAPAEADPTDHGIAFEPTAEDLAWWSANAPHEGGCHPDALTPEEEDMEWEHSEMLEERAALVAAFDRYEAGFGW